MFTKFSSPIAKNFPQKFIPRANYFQNLPKIFQKYRKNRNNFECKAYFSFFLAISRSKNGFFFGFKTFTLNPGLFIPSVPISDFFSP